MRILLAIIAVAVALRVGAALYLGDTIVDLPGIFDQVSYDTLARRILAGHGFTFPTIWWPYTQPDAPTAHWSFLYTLYLTAIYGLTGEHALVARLVQAVIAGILYPLLAWRLGRRLFGARVGLLAAGWIAGYGYFVYYAGALMTETFYILTVLWALDLATGPLQDRRALPRGPGWRGAARAAAPWAWLGLSLGAAALFRQLILVFVPVIVAWLAWTWLRGPVAAGWSFRDRARSLIGGLAITAAVMGALILPWTARNYSEFGRFVLLNTNAGYAFFWGNHPIHGTNFVSIFPSGVYRDLIPEELRSLDEAALDNALLKESIPFVTDNPGRYLLLSVSRLKDYFEFLPSQDSHPLSNIVRITSFGLSLPLSLYGLYVAISMYRDSAFQAKRPAFVLIVLFMTVYSGIHLLSWALTRYRLPVDAVLCVFVAVALADLWDRIRPAVTKRAGQRQPKQSTKIGARVSASTS